MKLDGFIWFALSRIVKTSTWIIHVKLCPHAENRSIVASKTFFYDPKCLRFAVDAFASFMIKNHPRVRTESRFVEHSLMFGVERQINKILWKNMSVKLNKRVMKKTCFVSTNTLKRFIRNSNFFSSNNEKPFQVFIRLTRTF